jgi:hypothetical protein
MHDDLEIINEALDAIDPTLAFTWREVNGHAHDGSGPMRQGKSFRALGEQQGIMHTIVRDRYRTADREVCANFARYYRQHYGIGGELGNQVLAPPQRFVTRRRLLG